MRVVLGAGFLAAVLVFCIAVPSAHAAPGSASNEMLGQINQVRRANGLAPLRRSQTLQNTARGYAGYILRRDYFGHLARIRASSRFRRLGEIIAIHRGRRLSIRGTIRDWLRSPPHRALILSGAFRFAGAGTRNGRFRGRGSRTWVVHFGR